MSRLDKEITAAAAGPIEQSSAITYGTVGINAEEHPHHLKQEDEATQKEKGTTSFFGQQTENYYKIVDFSQA